MICPNCGRRNSAGATFCSRCRQRLPLAAKLNGTHRRATMVEPRGGGGGGVIVLAVALLAGFLFIGGAAMIYVSSPPSDPGNSSIGDASARPTLPPFVQTTASPTPSPTFILLPSESFSPSPSASGFVTPSPITTAPPATPVGPTQAPTPRPVVARFDWNQKGTTLEVKFTDKSKGNPTQWEWDFGDGLEHSTQQNPEHTYLEYKSYTVKLIVTGPGGTATVTHNVTLEPEPTDPPTAPPSLSPSPNPSPTVVPTITVEPPPPST